MNVAYLPPEVLKKSVVDLIHECRKNLKAGKTADVSQVENGVRAFCASVAALPADEGKKHKSDLRELMKLVTELGDDLVAARDAVKEELAKLDHVRKAHKAYKSSSNMDVKKGSTDD